MPAKKSPQPKTRRSSDSQNKSEKQRLKQRTTANSIARDASSKKPDSPLKIDWYLVNLGLHLIGFAMIGVLDLSSDRWADVCYQCIGITIALIRIANPDSWLLSELLNFRIATRVLRPLSLWNVVLERISSLGVGDANTLFAVANTLHDASLVIVGCCILFGVNRVDIARAVYRECWFVMACLRLVLFRADPIAASSCVLEILATNCLLFVLVTGGRVVPARLVGVFGFCVGSQKLWYLVDSLLN